MEDFMKYNFNITKIALACFVPQNGGTPVHKNRSYHGLAFHTGGQRYYTFDSGEKLLAKGNDIVYLPKHSNYTVQKIVPGDCYAINFDLLEDIYFEPFLHKAKNAALYLESFKKAESCWKSRSQCFEMRCKAEAYQILCTIAEEFASGYASASKTQILQPAMDFIHKEYTKENIPVTLLAQLCGISEIYFRKIFHQVKGVSPLKYINHLKLERAKELLLSEMYTVSQVAELSGFHDESYFSREFKKHFLIPPSEYAKRTAAK